MVEHFFSNSVLGYISIILIVVLIAWVRGEILMKWKEKR